MPRIQPSVVKEGSFVFKREGKWWLGEAPAIQGAYTQGHTLAEARYNLVSLIKDLTRLAGRGPRGPRVNRARPAQPTRKRAASPRR